MIARRAGCPTRRAADACSCCRPACWRLIGVAAVLYLRRRPKAIARRRWRRRCCWALPRADAPARCCGRRRDRAWHSPPEAIVVRRAAGAGPGARASGRRAAGDAGALRPARAQPAPRKASVWRGGSAPRRSASPPASSRRRCGSPRWPYAAPPARGAGRARRARADSGRRRRPCTRRRGGSRLRSIAHAVIVGCCCFRLAKVRDTAIR